MSGYPRRWWWLVGVAVPLVAAALPSLLSYLPTTVNDKRPNTESLARLPTQSKGTRPALPTEPTHESEDLDERSPSAANSAAASALEPTRGKAAESIAGVPEGHELLQASGVGYPPANVPEAGRRQALARRAAEVDAFRRLAEQVKGAVVRATTSTQGLALSTDEVRVEVDAIIKLAKITQETIRPDGSVEVVVQAPSQADINRNK